MRKNLKKMTMFACMALVSLSSCGFSAPNVATGNNTQNSASEGAQIGSGILGSLLGNILGSGNTVKQADLIGAWNYVGSDCKFESENLLKQAGGEIAAKTLKGKMDDMFEKVGIKAGAFGYTFNEDGSYSMNLGGRSISGTYTLDEANGKLTLVGMLGLTKMDATVVKSNNQISILYDASKLMQVVTAIGSQSGNATIKTVSTLLDSYEGVKVGFALSK